MVFGGFWGEVTNASGPMNVWPILVATQRPGGHQAWDSTPNTGAYVS